MIIIQIYHYNYKYLNEVVSYILKIFKFFNIQIKSKVLEKVMLNNITLLKSPHVHKKAQENFGVSYYKYCFKLSEFKQHFSYIGYIYYILSKSNCFFKFYFL